MNIAELERDLAKKDTITATLKSQMAAAETEKRERTTEEITALEAMLTEGKQLKARIERAKADEGMTAEIARLTEGMVVGPLNASTPTRELRSMGRQFIEDESYRKFISSHGHRRSGAWMSPTVELHATTLDTTSGSGGPLIMPQVLPGILPLQFKRLTISDLLAQGTVDSNSLLYMREKTFTNAAAPVTEGAAKPESTLVFDQATAPVQKIAHWLPVTEEMLEDFSAIRSYIDARLRLGLDLTKEDQLLNGSGTPPALLGLLNTPGLTAAQARGADSNADAIFREITKVVLASFIQPDGIVLNPTNWQTIQLTKNAAGNYLGTGPWGAAQTPMLWGLPVVSTPSIVANTALVGAFQQCAQEFAKGGVRVEVSNSHSDFFVKNLVAIRAEQRLALAVYRPAAFGTVTGLN
jgi:HK97 family phage major capsid protein